MTDENIVIEDATTEDPQPTRWERVKAWCASHPAIVGLGIGAATAALALVLAPKPEPEEQPEEEPALEAGEDS